MKARILRAPAVALGLVLCFLLATPSSAAERWNKARGVLVPCENPVDDRYLVMLEPSALDNLPAAALQGRERAEAMTAEVLTGEPGEVTHVFAAREAPGFSVRADAATAERLNRDPRVSWIEQACPIVPSAFHSWATDRVDQRTGYDQAFHFPGTGKGIHLYVMDTGIDPDTAEFGCRLLTGANDSKSFHPDEPNALEDDWDQFSFAGHGTSVAALAAGTRYGIAKEAYVHSVRIFGDPSPAGQQPTTTAEFVAAMQWVRTQGSQPAVVNMSFYIPSSTPQVPFSAMAAEITAAHNAGFVLVASSNNSGFDTCAQGEMPSSLPEVITVGATKQNDEVHPGSNFGACVDLYAPGDGIPSLAPNGSQQSVAGTSFAAPLVSGAAALRLQAQPSTTPAAMKTYLVNQSTKNVLTNVQANSHNRLLYLAPDGRDSNACFAWSCDVATQVCTFNMGCSWMEGGLGYYLLEFGDGQSYYGGSAVVTHTYPAQDLYLPELDLIPWYAPPDNQSACLNTHGAGAGGCYRCSTAY